MTQVANLVLAWFTGAGVLLLCVLGLLVLGYISRMIVPVDAWNDPFNYPSWKLTVEDVGASLIAGLIAAIAIFVPLCIGASILV